MSSNNYMSPYYFSQPPPTFSASNSWNYNWPISQQSTGSLQRSRVAPPPPPPSYPPPANCRVSASASTINTVNSDQSYAPPPPPPPYPPPNSCRVSGSVPSVNTVSSEQNSHGYYNSSTAGSYRTRRYSSSASGQYNGSTQYSTQHGHYNTSPGQYNSMSPGQYMNSNSPGYSRNHYGKRKSDLESDNLKKSGKKKKKPLSQNVPQRKDWSVDDAKWALMVEKDYNKRNKSQSLIIKFPDLELNRDIVSKFNPAIESVHFQQPSTPRFCFVTLKDSVDPEVIIKELNKTPFGQGHLTAEYKKDREDEINIGPEDIDPLTLYVGNLAQEVTKEDMVNTYPKQKRIDIGYAKKMKYTRYAFVSFKSVEDSIEAFRKTHATQMYSKSLIVRFRRLNGTVGMPGEPKPQMPQRNDAGENHNGGPHTSMSNDHNDSGNHNNSSDLETDSRLAPWEMVDVSNWETNLKYVKEEPPGDSDDEDEVEMDTKPPLPNHTTPFMPGSLELAISLHKPKIKVECKNEPANEEYSIPQATAASNSENAKLSARHEPEVKPEVNIADNDCLIINTDKIKTEPIKTDGTNTYEALRSLNRKGRSIDFVPITVKREVSTPTLDEVSHDYEERASSADTEEYVAVKNEPADEGDDTQDGDYDSSDSDDLDFSDMLSSIKAKKKKKFKKSTP